jgi:hypothetical protein
MALHITLIERHEARLNSLEMDREGKQKSDFYTLSLMSNGELVLSVRNSL